MDNIHINWKFWKIPNPGSERLWTVIVSESIPNRRFDCKRIV